jgi:M6 family metalloprotease-like protein
VFIGGFFRFLGLVPLGVFVLASAQAGEMQIVRRPHSLRPREGEAINRLITHKPKVEYRSRSNRSFRMHERLAAHPTRVDTIKVLALRVEFQEDTSPLTTGDGKMDYKGFLDPSWGLLHDPPHTREYFEKLMDALNNFYALNSLGKCRITSTVMPPGVAEAYKLPHDMLYYGDTISMEGVETGLTRLTRDAIKVADQDPAIRFSDYDLLVIFHAGSTAQTDLRGDSPFDLFTGTLDERAFQAYLGEPYVLADEGRTRITAATVLPEMARQDTMYQGQTSIIGMTGLEGMLYHEFCHLLGGVDLYDVFYNSMGVGAWSLMGYGGWLGDWGLGVPPGTIPSLLDAWHKVYFGWVDPLVVNVPKKEIPLLAAEMDTGCYRLRGDSLHPIIVKVPISPTEYFLLENRETDVKHKDTLIVHVEGEIPVSVFDGEYDFFQPGSGVLIWHVDDSVIAEFAPYNMVNYDPQHKGVDLVEGDGIQDYDSWSGKSQYNYQIYGSAYDPFFVGGYNDTLSATTIPNSDGYQGKTFFTIGILSGPDTLMPVSVAADLGQPGFPQNPGREMPYTAATFADIAQDGRQQIVVADTGGRILAWNADGTSFLAGRTNGTFIQLPNGTTHSAVTVGDITGDNRLEIICAGDNGRVYAYTPQATPVSGFPVMTQDRITATPVLADLNHDGKQEIIVGSTDGKLYVWQGNGRSYPGFPLALGVELRSAVALTDPVDPGIAVLASDGRLYLVRTDGTIAPGFPVQLGLGSLYTLAAPVVGDIDRDGQREIVCVVSGGYDYKVVAVNLSGDIVYRSRSLVRFPFYGTPLLVDVNQDGYLETVLAAKNFLYAFNRTGTLVTNYPFAQESTFTVTEVAGNWLISYENPFIFNSSPVVGDLDADGILDFAIGSPRYGVLLLNGRNGRQLQYSPLSTGSSVSATPLIADIDRDGKTELAVGSDDGVFHVWKLPGDPASLVWGSFLKDPSHTGFYSDAELPEMPPAPNVIADKFYVYPNPAEKFATARFTLGSVTNAGARIKILDVSGLPLLEMTAPAYPAADNEKQFSVQNLPSGIYIVRLDVLADEGKVVKFYKLGIVR